MFTLDEDRRLGTGHVFIRSPWQQVLNHAARIIGRPLASTDEAYDIIRRFTLPSATSIPQPDELHVFLIAHRLLFTPSPRPSLNPLYNSSDEFNIR